MGRFVGSLPDYPMAFVDIIFASSKQRRLAKMEARRVFQLHGQSSLLWLQADIRKVREHRHERRVLCLAYWYLTLVMHKGPDWWRTKAIESAAKPD